MPPFLLWPCQLLPKRCDNYVVEKQHERIVVPTSDAENLALHRSSSRQPRRTAAWTLATW